MKRKTQNAIRYNPEWTPEGMRERWRCVENASAGLRIVGACHDIARAEGCWRTIDHTGWHLDPWGDGETATGYVLQLPSRGHEPCYIPAIADPYEPDCFIVDFHSVTADKMDAARWSDRMAERYAEAEREYQTKDAAERAIEDAREEIKTARGEHSALAAELRAAANWRNVSAPAICAAVRRDLARHRDTVRDAIKRIRKLSDNPYSIIEGC